MFRGFVWVRSANQEGHGDVLEGGELGEERGGLPNEANVAVAEVGELAVVEGGEVAPVEVDGACAGTV
jgi:hypothetical protein